jgi:RNA polymerase-binding transcription factor DksA
MRRHFHRCAHLRVFSVDAAERGRARKGGSEILEELCDARKLAPCVGLAECDVLGPAEKRELLVARATRLRAEEGGRSLLADGADSRAEELEALRADFLAEHREIVEENRRLHAEAAGALKRNPRPPPASRRELERAGVSVFENEELRELRTARLDALERGLDALGRGAYGRCASCAGPIAVARLRDAPDSAVCGPCAERAVYGAPVYRPGSGSAIPGAGSSS